ncbi:MAG: phage major capsid protein [Lachnospiraceae bacterium]|nr:phage major capsid protein [Lachnospiraceae bacterium]
MFNKDAIMAMSQEQLNARLKEINSQAKTATGEELNDLLAEAEFISEVKAEASNRAKLMAMTQTVEEPKAKEQEAEVSAKAKRGKELKDGNKVTFDSKVAGVRNAVTSADAVMPVHTADDIKPTFNDVSSLIDRVHTLYLPGGETYQRGYITGYGDGAGATAEGADYNATEPTFGYVTVKKEKVTAYTEEPEEMIKLPNADYDSVVEGSVTKSIRRYLTRQILIGNGNTSKLKGIFYNPTDEKEVAVIDATTDLELSAIDDTTLDEIIYSYGGEEEVEDVAVLILNKKDLKAFAKLRDKQGRKVYTVINHGNTGTIDGVPFIINSACGAISDAATVAETYCMAYGPLSNYELAVFSDIDAQRSTHYKFRQGQVAYRADIYVGGAVAAKNGFLRVKTPKAAA